MYFQTQTLTMKRILIFLSCALMMSQLNAQSDKEKVEHACLDYIEGFYEGDTTKLARSVMPLLNKWGYWKNDKSGKHESDGQMTYRQAIDYAKRVFEKKNFAKADAPKKVEVYDIMRSIASAKVTAWWGVDYILLSKQGDRWMIEQVLWEGPLEK
jgi:DNA phosphorothioation-dependent restriction protein DptG